MDIFEKNLEALSHVDTELEKSLQKISENKRFEVYLSEGDDVENANIFDHETKETIYIEKPLLEIAHQLKKFEEYDNYPILYFFGVGNGAFYKLLLENKKHQRINVYEPELEIIYIVLNLYDFSQDILELRFVLALGDTVNKKYFMASLNNITKYFLKSYDFHVHTKFYNRYQDEIERINKDIITSLKHRLYLLGNHLEDTLVGLRYSLKNIPKMLKTPTLSSIMASKNSKSAIIVSTGPSLTKQLPLLKSIQDYVTILCIDASFPILAQEGIKPDLVFSMERIAATAKFYLDTPKEFHKDVIFLLATVCHDEVINSVQGELSLYMRPDTYNTSLGLTQWGYLGGGQSSAHFAYNFAMQVQYENIIFIGQDLSYGKDGVSHAANHRYGVNDVDTKKTFGEVEAYGGVGTVPTTEVWIAFLNSFTEMTNLNKNRVINCTEGGARIQGTEEIAFKEVCESIIDKENVKKPMQAKIPSTEVLKEKLLQFTKKKNEVIGLGENMFLSVEKLYRELDVFLYDLYDNENEEKKDTLERVILKDLDILVSKVDIIKADFNAQVFVSIFGGLFAGYAINHEYNVASVYVMRDTTELEKKEKSLEWLKVHYEWLSRVGISLEKILKAYKQT